MGYTKTKYLAEQEIEEKILELIKGEIYPNRLFLHEMLAPIKNKSQRFEEISLLLEKVTQAQLSWVDFRIKAKGILSKPSTNENSTSK